MPASSKMDPPLAKAKPISYGDGITGITAREERIWVRNSSADTKTSETTEGGGAPGAKVEIPLQSMGKFTVTQAVLLQSKEVHGGADIHLQPLEEPTPKQVGAQSRQQPCGKLMLEQVPGRTCGTVATGGERSSHRSRFAGRICDPMGDPQWSSLLLKDCAPWKRPMLEKFGKN
ncbi:protein pxr1-like [Pitangus sulphuratus]|nr:protein pxr1-like [Pitangus sulphuratus]